MIIYKDMNTIFHRLMDEQSISITHNIQFIDTGTYIIIEHVMGCRCIRFTHCVVSRHFAQSSIFAVQPSLTEVKYLISCLVNREATEKSSAVGRF